MAAPLAQNPDRVYGVSNIKSHIPVLLDLEESNYDAWRELFYTHCLSFDVVGHIDGTLLPANDADISWKKRDGIVKLWLYGTLSPKLFESSFKSGSSSRQIWLCIENLFRNNKDARALKLDHELRTKEIGDMKVADYCSQMKKLADSLAHVDAPVQDRNLVMYILNGLNAKFDNIINVIKHRQPFPSYDDATAMLLDEEDRLRRSIKPNPSHIDHSSSSTVLAVSEVDQNRSVHQQSRGRGRGNKGRGRGRSYNNFSRPCNQPPQFSNWNNSPPPFYSAPYPMWHHPWNAPNNFLGNGQGYGMLGNRPYTYTGATNQQQSSSKYEPTSDINQVFNTMTLHDPSDSQWYMDSGATSHLTSGAGSSHQGDSSPQ